MKTNRFEDIVERQISKSKNVLVTKAKEYATQDRLHNFRVAANLQGVSEKQALAGFMAKHTVSVYDMCRSDEIHPPSTWEEKITDHINYLLLLKAIVEEEYENEKVKLSAAVNKSRSENNDPAIRKAPVPKDHPFHSGNIKL